MAHDEAQQIREMSDVTVSMTKKYLDRTHYLYGPFDNYAPEAYFQELKRRFPEG
jgi:hypothetical protein